MPENVSIAYRGAHYAIGQGPQFYGIWHAAAPQAQPLEWWPLTPEGWTGAWSRFASVEVPGTIVQITVPPAGGGAAAAAPAAPAAVPATAVPATAVPVTAAGADVPAGYAQPATPGYAQVESRPVDPARQARKARIGAGLLALGVILGIVGLFPAYTAGVSLASQPAELVPHAVYLAAWAVSAGLVLLSGTWRQAGALAALGVSVVTFGLFFADAGIPMADGAHFLGAGLIVSVIGWLACTAGAGLAFSSAGLSFRRWPLVRRGADRQFARPSAHEVVPIVTIILAAIGAAIAFAPSWDSFLLQTTAGGSQTVTQGNAFANPAPVIIGDVLVMVLLVAVLAVAALWRPVRLGAALALGAIIPMVAQAISAIVQIAEPTSPLQFGITQAQASAVGLTITNGLTAMFWVYCAFLGTLVLLCAWMLLTHEQAPGQVPAYPGQPAYWPGSGYPVPAYAPSGPGRPAGPANVPPGGASPDTQ